MMKLFLLCAVGIVCVFSHAVCGFLSHRIRYFNLMNYIVHLILLLVNTCIAIYFAKVNNFLR